MLPLWSHFRSFTVFQILLGRSKMPRISGHFLHFKLVYITKLRKICGTVPAIVVLHIQKWRTWHWLTRNNQTATAFSTAYNEFFTWFSFLSSSQSIDSCICHFVFGVKLHGVSSAVHDLRVIRAIGEGLHCLRDNTQLKIFVFFCFLLSTADCTKLSKQFFLLYLTKLCLFVGSRNKKRSYRRRRVNSVPFSSVKLEIKNFPLETKFLLRWHNFSLGLRCRSSEFIFEDCMQISTIGSQISRFFNVKVKVAKKIFSSFLLGGGIL